MTLRLLLVLQNDEVVRLSLARFERLYARPPLDRVPELAGQRVRAAEAVVETNDRQPARVVRVVYHYLHFDAEGALDTERFRGDARIAVEAGADSFWQPPADPTLVDARHRFARRRRDHEVWWTPSPDLVQHINRAALGDRGYRILSERSR